MKNITKDIYEEIKNLKNEETIFVSCPDKLCNKLQLNLLQKQSLQNIFLSYMNSTSEIMEEFKLDDLLKQYQDITINETNIIFDYMLDAIGYDAYNLVLNTMVAGFKTYYYYIDWNLKKMIIGLAGSNAQKTISECST